MCWAAPGCTWTQSVEASQLPRHANPRPRGLPAGCATGRHSWALGPRRSVLSRKCWRIPDGYFGSFRTSPTLLPSSDCRLVPRGVCLTGVLASQPLPRSPLLAAASSQPHSLQLKLFANTILSQRKVAPLSSLWRPPLAAVLLSRRPALLPSLRCADAR